MKPASSTVASSTTLRWSSWRLWKPALFIGTLWVALMVLTRLMSVGTLGYVLMVVGMICAVVGPRLARARRGAPGGGIEQSPGFFYFLLCFLGARHCWVVAKPPEPGSAEWEVIAQMSLLAVAGLGYWRLWSRPRSRPSPEVPTPLA